MTLENINIPQIRNIKGIHGYLHGHEMDNTIKVETWNILAMWRATQNLRKELEKYGVGITAQWIRKQRSLM